MKIKLSLILPTILITTNLLSNTTSQNNNITIYNDNLRFFDETKKIENINKGIDNIIYDNISTNLIKDSVFISFNKNNIKVLEQDYKFDLVNFNNILQHNINNEITYFDEDNDKKQTKKRGILLSFEHNNSTIKDIETNNILSINSKNIIIDKLPNGMITKPSLIFKTNSDNNYQNVDANLKYLSYGFNWKADYIFNIDNETLTSNGMITINNNTDLNFNNYNLKLIAGKINNIDTPKINPRMMMNRNMALKSLDEYDNNVSHQPFNGYHIYQIPFKVDINARTQKQINFINFKTNKWKKINKLSINGNNKIFKNNFNQIITFDNKKENGLGIPLPEGNVRVYGKNPIDNNITFLGSDKIDNTSVNETVEINIGENFDSIFKSTVIESNKNFYLMRYNITNNSNEKQSYFIKQNMYNPEYLEPKDVKMYYNSSCVKDKKCNIKELSDNVIIYEINLKENEIYNFKTHFSNKEIINILN